MLKTLLKNRIIRPGAISRTFLIWLLLAGTATVALLSAVYMFFNMVKPWPLYCRENADIFGTLLLLKGLNPYALAEHPVFLYSYGIVHSLITYPFAATFGHTLQVHRAVACTALVLACAVLFRGMRLSKVSRRLAICGALLFFIHHVFSFSISAKPDSLGELFFLLSVVAPLAGDFQKRSLGCAILFSLLAFYTKPYFGVGGLLVAGYLGLCRSKALGVAFALGLAGALMASAALVNRLFPLYFTDTFWMFVNLPPNEHFAGVRHLLGVLRDYSVLGAGLAAILIWSGLCRRDPESVPTRLRIDLRHFSQPLLQEPTLAWVSFCLVANTLLYLFKMGLNTGNDKMYIFHIVLPFLIWRSIMVVEDQGRERRPPVIFLGITVLLVFRFLVKNDLQGTFMMKKYEEASWRHATKIVSTHKNVFGCRLLAGILWNQGRPIYEAGQTEFYPGSLRRNPSPLASAYRARCKESMDSLLRKIRNREFDAIILINGRDSQMIKAETVSPYYRKTDQFCLWCPFVNPDVTVWEPNPGMPP